MALDRIGPFEVAAELVRRRGVQVYKGYDPLVHRDAAVSILSPDWAAKAEFMGLVRDRVRAARAVRHAHLARTLDFGDHEGQPYVAMEMLEGRDLARLRDESAAKPLAWKLELLAQAAEGLHQAHDAGIVHGDLKPSKLLLVEDGTVKVLDLGIPPPPGWVFADFAGDLADHTYRSPEQLQGGTLDARSDIFSLGVVAHEFLTGRHPFGNEDARATRARILAGELVEAPDGATPVPVWLDRLLRRCLDRDPARRFASCGELAAALRASPPEEGTSDVTQIPAAEPAVEAVPAAAPTPAEAADPASAVVWERALVAAAAPLSTEKATADDFALAELDSAPAPAPPSFNDEAAPENRRMAPGRVMAGAALLVALGLLTWFAVATWRSPEAPAVTSPSPLAALPSPASVLTPEPATIAAKPPTVKPPTAANPRVESLLAEARAHAAANDWTSPAGHCALDAYVEALNLAPGNDEAKTGIASVAAFFIQRGKELKAQGDQAGAIIRFDKARKVLDTAGVAAELTNLEALRRELEAATAPPK